MNDFITDHIEKICILAIVGLLGFAVLIHHHTETVAMPEAFRAWEKQTGNPQHLQYEEWRSLVRASERTDNSTIILMPIR